MDIDLKRKDIKNNYFFSYIVVYSTFIIKLNNTIEILYCLIECNQKNNTDINLTGKKRTS